LSAAGWRGTGRAVLGDQLQLFLPARFAVTRFRNRCALAARMVREATSQEERVPVSNIVGLIDGPVRVRLDDFAGSFELSPRSRVFHRILKSGSYEPELARLVRDLVPTGSQVIDVGANVGFYSVLMASLVGRNGEVLAVEPNSQAIGLLQTNILANEVDDVVTVRPVAVGSTSGGQGALYSIEGQPEFSSLNPSLHPAGRGPVESKPVEVLTIDRLARESGINPRFIKIDIEGGELEALRGAEEVLLTARPSVLCEIAGIGQTGAGHWSRVMGYMTGLGFRPVSVDDRRTVPVETRMGSDVLFLPKSQ